MYYELPALTRTERLTYASVGIEARSSSHATMRKFRDNRFKKESEQKRKDDQRAVRSQQHKKEGAVDTLALRKAIHRAHAAGTGVSDLAKRTRWQQKKIQEVLAEPLDTTEPDC